MRAHVVAILGGRCSSCGSADDLHIHHIHRNGLRCRKRNGQGYTHLKHHVDARDITSELSLLCRRCHFSEHADDRNPGRNIPLPPPPAWEPDWLKPTSVIPEHDHTWQPLLGNKLEHCPPCSEVRAVA